MTLQTQHAVLALFLALLLAFGALLGLHIGIRREGPLLGAPASSEEKAWYVRLNERIGRKVKISMLVVGVLAIACGILAFTI
jgi:hypothetical protein